MKPDAQGEMQVMLGEASFAQRLGDIYCLSPIPYACGHGMLSGGNDAIQVDWEINCAVTGDVVLALTSQVLLDLNRMLNADRTFREWALTGRCLDNSRELRGEGVIVPNVRFTVGQNPELPRYYCLFRSLDLRDRPARIPTAITAYLFNFRFEGIDWTARDRGGVADSFTVNVAGRPVAFRQHDQLDQLRNLLAIARIDRALLSTVTIPLMDSETITHGLAILERLEWLTAMLSQNRTFSPVIRVDGDGECCGWIMPNVSSAPIVGRELIDNFIIPAGLRSTIEAIYDRFGEVDARIDLKRFVDIILVVAQQKHAEFKLAGLIPAFEYLCTKLLDAYGRPAKPENSIQDKLRMLNGFLRFIPRELLGEELRADIRNPLFHTGIIVGADMRTLWTWFTRYFDLLSQIFFVILDFRGAYISAETNAPQNVPVPAQPAPQIR